MSLTSSLSLHKLQPMYRNCIIQLQLIIYPQNLISYLFLAITFWHYFAYNQCPDSLWWEDYIVLYLSICVFPFTWNISWHLEFNTNTVTPMYFEISIQLTLLCFVLKCVIVFMVYYKDKHDMRVCGWYNHAHFIMFIG